MSHVSPSLFGHGHWASGPQRRQTRGTRLRGKARGFRWWRSLGVGGGSTPIVGALLLLFLLSAIPPLGSSGPQRPPHSGPPAWLKVLKVNLVSFVAAEFNRHAQDDL